MRKTAVFGKVTVRRKVPHRASEKAKKHPCQGAFFALAHLFLLGYRVREKQIIRMEGSHFEIQANENVVWNFDGEKGLSGNVVIDVLHKKINMLVPKGSKNL